MGLLADTKKANQIQERSFIILVNSMIHRKLLPENENFLGELCLKERRVVHRIQPQLAFSPVIQGM